MAVAYILHLAVEGPVIAGDAFLFKRPQRSDRRCDALSEVCQPDEKDNRTKDAENLKSVERKENGFRTIMLNPVDLKQIYKL